MRAGAGPRLLRAAVFTAVCVVLSAAGHAFASCAPVPPWALAAGFLAVFLCVAPFAGRRRSLPGISLALAGGQLGLHALFGLGQHTAAPRPSAEDSLAALAARLLCGGNTVPLSPARAREVLDAAGIDPAGAAAQAHAAAGAGHAHPGAGGTAEGIVSVAEPVTGLLSLPMFLGHLLAALAAGWLLGRGDRALARLLRPAAGTPVRSLRAALVYAHLLGAGIGRVGPTGPERAPAERAGAVGRGREALHHSVIRRGPPAGFVLAA